MVGAPAMARVEGAAQRRLAVRLLSSALICGLGGMAAVRIGANILATWVYNEPELAGMFILSAPLTLLFAVQHAVNALLSGLGEQRQALMPRAGRIVADAGTAAPLDGPARRAHRRSHPRHAIGTKRNAAIHAGAAGAGAAAK